MAATIVERNAEFIVIQTKIPINGVSMLADEETILRAVNETGAAATGEALGRHDADGRPIKTGDVKWYSKGKSAQTYQTPYGAVCVERHTYQHGQGGATFCPLEDKARTCLTATPRLAKLVTSKYQQNGSVRVVGDLGENHALELSREYIGSLCDFVGSVAMATDESWEYELPALEEPVAYVALSLDGTCMLLAKEGWREAMCGAISLYNSAGDRLHTVYVGAAPEAGKESFLERLDREYGRIRSSFPSAKTIGLADGAKSNWTFLEPRTDRQIVDFWHASEYVHTLAGALYPRAPQAKDKSAWLEITLHNLKHAQGATGRLIKELEGRREEVAKSRREEYDQALGYFKNNRVRMNWGYLTARNAPIGSGVCEAACKTLIKSRLCASGMRWKRDGAAAVISLRALHETLGRWGQFWSKIAQHGVQG